TASSRRAATAARVSPPASSAARARCSGVSPASTRLKAAARRRRLASSHLSEAALSSSWSRASGSGGLEWGGANRVLRCKRPRYFSPDGRRRSGMRRSGPSQLAVNLGALLLELAGLLLHALGQRRLLVHALPGGVVAHVLGDLHRAEVRAAHRAEVGQLGALLRQRLVVEFLGLLRIQAEIELVFPAELEARLGQRVV